MKIDLSGKRVLVTGSSSGIGQEIATAFNKVGAHVVVQYNSDEAGAKETVEAFDGGGKHLIVGGNVAEESVVAGWFEKIDTELGGIDIVINNAGIDGERKKVGELPTSEWSKVISVNLDGAFFCMQEAIRRMRRMGSGVIISVTSVHEEVPWSGHAAYCAAKAGVSMLTKSVALELSDTDIRVLCVAPGAIKTDINEDVWSDPKKRKDLEEKIPMGRLGKTSEVANAVVALASDTVGAYVTGTTLFIDGGMQCYANFEEGG